MTGSDIFERARWKNASNQDGSCVDLAIVTGALGVRDSKNPFGPRLAFPSRQGEAFLTSVKLGRFDV